MKFKEEEKAKKLAQKKAKQEAARQKAEEEERVNILSFKFSYSRRPYENMYI